MKKILITRRLLKSCEEKASLHTLIFLTLTEVSLRHKNFRVKKRMSKISKEMLESSSFFTTHLVELFKNHERLPSPNPSTNTYLLPFIDSYEILKKRKLKPSSELQNHS